jgi:hypothetical protein
VPSAKPRLSNRWRESIGPLITTPSLHNSRVYANLESHRLDAWYEKGAGLARGRGCWPCLEQYMLRSYSKNYYQRVKLNQQTWPWLHSYLWRQWSGFPPDQRKTDSNELLVCSVTAIIPLTPEERFGCTASCLLSGHMVSKRMLKMIDVCKTIR